MKHFVVYKNVYIIINNLNIYFLNYLSIYIIVSLFTVD